MADFLIAHADRVRRQHGSRTNVPNRFGRDRTITTKAQVDDALESGVWDREWPTIVIGRS